MFEGRLQREILRSYRQQGETRRKQTMPGVWKLGHLQIDKILHARNKNKVIYQRAILYKKRRSSWKLKIR